METLIKSSALASCEEHMNLRADTVTAMQGQRRACGTAGLHTMAWDFGESLL